jgi:hypothetical protein
LNVWSHFCVYMAEFHIMKKADHLHFTSWQIPQIYHSQRNSQSLVLKNSQYLQYVIRSNTGNSNRVSKSWKLKLTDKEVHASVLLLQRIAMKRLIQ